MIKILPLEQKHYEVISGLHFQELKNDFLPSLGMNFLKALYKGVTTYKNSFGFVAISNKQVVGFVVGTENMNNYLSSVLKANFIEIFLNVLFSLIKKPILFPKVIETFLYSSKEKGPPAELVVLAVSSKFQGRGIGKLLTKRIDNEFKKKKILRYKLTVHADKKAVYFYQKLGYDRLSQFKLYGKVWYIYEKSFSKK